MTYEKSCGFIAYQLCNNTREYLVLQSLNGDFGFPKGHVEKDETEYETALRELKEETKELKELNEEIVNNRAKMIDEWLNGEEVNNE